MSTVVTMDHNTTIQVESLVDFDAETWKEFLTELPKPVGNSREDHHEERHEQATKRKKVQADKPSRSEEYRNVALIHRAIRLDISDDCFRGSFSTEIPDTHVPVSFDITNDKDQMEEDAISMAFMTIYTNDGALPILRMRFNQATLHPELKDDLDWMNKVRKAQIPGRRSKASLLESLIQSNHLRVEYSPDGKLVMHLRISLKVVPQNEWSENSLFLSQKWWNLFSKAFPKGRPCLENEPVSTSEFYSFAYVPEKGTPVPDSIQHTTLQCDLLPFQRRAVAWMLRREGVELDSTSGNLKDSVDCPDSVPPTFFRQRDADGMECYVSHVFGYASKDVDVLQQKNNWLKGGILAEEMGLGKTVELIALLCLHERQSDLGSKVWDAYAEKQVISSGTTLIITPRSILHQWQNEIRMHSPSVKVMTYAGAKKTFGPNVDNATMVNNLLEYDVVLTTYDVLSSEIHYAQNLPERALRQRANRRQLRRSPLVEISWWRVCLDEAQMIEGGGSNAAKLAREIPRINAWAISGTPVRKDINDLYGLLLFLRYEPFCQQNRQVWNRLVNFNREAFKSIFQSLCLRHSKEGVHDEVTLPPQTRRVISIPFTQVEEQNYNELFTAMCKDLGVDETGAPLGDDYTPDETKLKMWLMRLRQTCLHPEVGDRNRKAFGSKNGPLRTVQEVLEVMIQQLKNNISSMERLRLASAIERGLMLKSERATKQAIEIWMSCLDDLKKLTEECRLALVEGRKKLLGGSANEMEKGNNGEQIEDETETTEAKSEELRGLRQRLRLFLAIEHECLFWIATAYYELKVKEEELIERLSGLSPVEGRNYVHAHGLPGPPDSEPYARLEAEYYEKAKQVRLEMMSETRLRAMRFMKTLDTKANSQSFVAVPEIESIGSVGGIESNAIFEAIDELAYHINDQTSLLDQFREKLIKNLREPLIDHIEDEDIQGDELEKSVKKQEKSFAIMSATRALVADREYAITAIKNTLAETETRQALARPNRVHLNYFRELVKFKDAARPPAELGSLKGHLTQLRRLVTKLKAYADDGNKRAQMELAVAEDRLKKLQNTMAVQVKTTSDLYKELELFRNATNARVDYYRQIQDISNSVEELDESKFVARPIEHHIVKANRLEAKLGRQIAEAKAKMRYLTHLQGQKQDESPKCAICLMVYEVGVLVKCGHTFCKECIQEWYRQARSCPQCKMHIKQADLYQISYKPLQAPIGSPAGTASPSTPPRTTTPQLYAEMDDYTLHEIKMIDLEVSFGSKVDMITRHLLWLKRNEPGFKAVIFSQWSDVLEVMKSSLQRFGIGFASLEKSNGIKKFREDLEVSCFLLHAKSQSAGLTLVNATHVFLCEPLLNAGVELQAISRVHRIGQTQQTTVWLYVVSGTVEQAVLDLATKKRLALISGNEPSEESSIQDQAWDEKLDISERLELREGVSRLLEKTPGGGEIVEYDDVWDCLFSQKKNSAAHKVALDGAVLDGEIPDNLPPVDENQLRRELMASAAERRNGIGVFASSSGA